MPSSQWEERVEVYCKIDERKQFIFQCENVDEADELKKLTYTLVFQYSDRWEVSLNDLVVKANPPSSNSVPNTN